MIGSSNLVGIQDRHARESAKCDGAGKKNRFPGSVTVTQWGKIEENIRNPPFPQLQAHLLGGSDPADYHLNLGLFQHSHPQRKGL